MKLRQQKYLINSIIIFINSILISTFIIYDNSWYVYIFILMLSSILNASSSILNILFRMSNKPPFQDYRFESKSYLYVVPCYNETEEELKNSIQSLILQRVVSEDERLILIICDGKVKGKGNEFSTDVILKDLLNIEKNEEGLYYDYETWNGTLNLICMYTTTYRYKNTDMPIILLVKENNYGKRDSLVLARKVCITFNRFLQYGVQGENKLIDHIILQLTDTYSNKIDFIIGIDGDTIFDYNCSYELIGGIEKDKNIHGCVGFVDIYPKMNKFSLFVMYQYAEYMFSQCLKRHAQSNITNKVNCLSGCNQILRVSEETCGEKILSVFNYCPNETDHILTHIRSYASEDRNHVCNMLSLYPYVKTTQNLKAISYTIVPTSVSVFLSQRRRWNLGANSNDVLLVYLPGINIFERISAFISVLTFIIAPFIFVVTIHFIISIITKPTMLMLYLSIILFVPLFYSFLIPIFIKPLPFIQSMYYYLSYIIFVCLSGLVSLITFSYAFSNMDNINWGKTRFIEENIVDEKENIVDDNDGFIDDNYIEVIHTEDIKNTFIAENNHKYYKGCTINLDDME
jgi:chitin synthase